GLSEARRAGVDLPPPGKGKTKRSTRKGAKYAYEAGQGRRKTKRRPRVSRAVSNVLKGEPRRAASHKALSRQARGAARQRSAAQRSAAARKAVRTKGAAGRSAAARKAARPRARRGQKGEARAGLLRQRLAFRFRQEQRRAEAEDVDERYRRGGAAEAAEIGNQGAGDERPDPGDQPRHVEHEAGGGRAHAGWKQLGQP